MSLLLPTPKEVCSDKTLEEYGGQKIEKDVVEEDLYLSKIEKIIQRDFFPDIPKLKAQNEYLAALEADDLAKVRELQMKYRPTSAVVPRPDTDLVDQTPEVTDSKQKQEDDKDTASVSGSSTKDPNDPAHLNLDRFLTTYISEDNASFERIKNEDDLRHRQKFRWMYDNEKKHALKYKDAASDGTMMITDVNGRQQPATVSDWDYKNVNAVMWIPEETTLTPEERAKRRQATAAREIKHTNTRLDKLPTLDPSSSFARERLTRSLGIKAAVDGHQVGVQGAEQTMRHPMQRYDLVATPSPAPGVNESPLMTWGEIEGTPFCLDASDTPLVTNTSGPTFKIPQIPKRDQYAHDLAEKFSKQYRQGKAKAVGRLTPRLGTGGSSKSAADRLSSMSPAARRLATSRLGIRLGTDKGLKQAYTPEHPSTPKTPLSTRAFRRPDASPAAAVVKGSITDNLMPIQKKNTPAAAAGGSSVEVPEKRRKAEDFF